MAVKIHNFQLNDLSIKRIVDRDFCYYGKLVQCENLNLFCTLEHYARTKQIVYP